MKGCHEAPTWLPVNGKFKISLYCCSGDANLITSDIVFPHEFAPPFHTSTIVSSFTLSLLSNTSCHTGTRLDHQCIRKYNWAMRDLMDLYQHVSPDAEDKFRYWLTMWVSLFLSHFFLMFSIPPLRLFCLLMVLPTWLLVPASSKFYRAIALLFLPAAKYEHAGLQVNFVSSSS